MNPAACTFEVTAATKAALMAQILGGALRNEDALTWTTERSNGDGQSQLVAEPSGQGIAY